MRTIIEQEQTEVTEKKTDIPQQQPDFSLVLGGPLFQLWRRMRLSGDALELARRRVLIIAGIAWIPLFILSLIDGHAMGGTVRIPFLYDIEAHVRFLIALPILVGAELVVHRRMRRSVGLFVIDHIIDDEDIPRFREAINSTLRLRNSRVVEVGLLALVYTVGVWLWRSHIAVGSANWYALHSGSSLNLTYAGYWYAFVSIPFFQFILLRWYFRFLLWFRFLWQVSKMNLRLVPTHPDRAAGIGFLGDSTFAFAPILFAQGTLLAGLIASRVLYEGQNLVAFRTEAAGFLVFFIIVVLSPLIAFTSRLSKAKREGLQEYGGLASRYVQSFDEKWLREGPINDGELLGTGDIQSMADLGNSFKVIEEMRIVPFGFKDVAMLAAVTVAPLLPLVLTVFSVGQLLTGLIRILF